MKGKAGSKKADKLKEGAPQVLVPGREPARDCRMYKTDTTCTGLLKMVCREKACKFYKSIHTS